MNKKVLGIIAEYNPFHLGHKYLIDEAKKITNADKIIILMSGNSVQRGDFAILDKYKRAKEAVLNGANLVLELPFCFSSQSAEHFAKGSINIFKNIGINYLCFGSESEDINNKIKIAQFLFEEEKNMNLDSQKNKNFAKERQEFLQNKFKNQADFSIMNNPNDILAIEYIKAIKFFDAKIEPIAIKRKGNNYHDQEVGEIFSSATSIRNLIKNENDIYEKLKKVTTKNMAEDLLKHKKQIVSFDNYFDELKSTIIKSENLDEIFEVSEGIENLIKKRILTSKNLDELIFSIKSKRYTYTRIRRILFNILIGISKKDMQKILSFKEKAYTKVLAFDDKGREILKENKEKNKKLLQKENIEEKTKEKLEIITKLADFKPQNDTQKIIFKYDRILNLLYYSKYEMLNNKKRVFTDEEISPIYFGNL